ncbi:hypothetical protein FACS189491_01220 [Spirochaetia bacterium]|nr:hypothetical protein FACS189491_01220 [Spirochaetia bacterium]
MGYFLFRAVKFIEKTWWRYFVQKPYRPFLRVANRSFIFLYAGDVPSNSHYKNKAIMGLSINQENSRHIKHNITHYHDLPDNSVDIYQAEDVFEHIEYEKLEYVLKDIYRILKPNGYITRTPEHYKNARSIVVDCYK